MIRTNSSATTPTSPASPPLHGTVSIIPLSSLINKLYTENKTAVCHRDHKTQLRIQSITLPVLCKIVVLVLHTLSLLTISLVTSTSASTKLLCLRAVMSSSRSVLIVDLFFAMILALIAAIFSTDIASDKDLNEQK